MKDNWEEKLACAVACASCKKAIGPQDLRILSSYTHHPICMDCKKIEEKKPYYAEVSQGMIGKCMVETEILYGDKGSYC